VTSRFARSTSPTSPSSTRTFDERLKIERSGVAILARRQRAGRDLVDERLEEVEVPPVDQRHLEVVVLAQLVDRLQPAEAAADHDHARAGVRLGRLRPAVEADRRAPDQRQRDAAEQQRDGEPDQRSEVGPVHPLSAPFTISCASSTIRSRCSSPRNDSA
jgi:hypothetical protein